MFCGLSCQLENYDNPLECRGNYCATSNDMEVATLAVDGWDVTFGTARRGLGGLWPTHQWPVYR